MVCFCDHSGRLFTYCRPSASLTPNSSTVTTQSEPPWINFEARLIRGLPVSRPPHPLGTSHRGVNNSMMSLTTTASTESSDHRDQATAQHASQRLREPIGKDHHRSVSPQALAARVQGREGSADSEVLSPTAERTSVCEPCMAMEVCSLLSQTGETCH